MFRLVSAAPKWPKKICFADSQDNYEDFVLTNGVSNKNIGGKKNPIVVEVLC